MEKLAILAVPISAYLWRMGGKHDKAYRRFDIPILFMIIACLAGIEWKHVLMGIAYHYAFRLPFTLIGDDINDSLLNWGWVTVWAFIICAPALIFSWHAIFPVGVSTLVIATCAYLSNIKETRDWATWDRCEIVFGAFVAIPLVFEII